MTFVPQIIFSIKRKEMISFAYVLSISITKLYVPVLINIHNKISYKYYRYTFESKGIF